MRAKLVVAVLLFAGAAHASDTFPERIELKTGATLPPQPHSCLLCHRTEDGGKSTVTKPFGLTMIDLGVQSGSRASVDGALVKLADEKLDSDGDGLDDLAELLAGRDPNVIEIESEDGGVISTGTVASANAPFETGCGVAVDRSRGNAPILVLLAGSLFCLRRRRAPHSPCES